MLTVSRIEIENIFVGNLVSEDIIALTELALKETSIDKLLAFAEGRLGAKEEGIVGDILVKILKDSAVDEITAERKTMHLSNDEKYAMYVRQLKRYNK